MRPDRDAAGGFSRGAQVGEMGDHHRARHGAQQLGERLAQESMPPRGAAVAEEDPHFVHGCFPRLAGKALRGVPSSKNHAFGLDTVSAGDLARVFYDAGGVILGGRHGDVQRNTIRHEQGMRDSQPDGIRIQCLA